MEVSLGDWMVTGSSLLVSVTAVILSEISAKLIKATVMAADKEIGKTARHADDDMKDVALGYAPHTPTE